MKSPRWLRTLFSGHHAAKVAESAALASCELSKKTADAAREKARGHIAAAKASLDRADESLVGHADATA